MKQRILAFILCSCLIFGCTGVVRADETADMVEVAETVVEGTEEEEASGTIQSAEEDVSEAAEEVISVPEDPVMMQEEEEVEEAVPEEDLETAGQYFKLVYDANGGWGSRSYDYWPMEDAVPVDGSGFIRVGYAFDGWYTEKECTNRISEFTYIDRNTTLYAGWTADYYTLQYDGNGGNIQSYVDYLTYNTVNIKKNSRIGLTTGNTKTPTAVRAGYVFDGFTYTKNGSDYLDLNDIITGNTVVYAKWHKNGESSDKPDGLELGVSYRTHVQDYGWQDYVYNGEVSGTQGQSKRLEGISIHLTGNYQMMTEPGTYGIIYRAQVQDYGWQDWAADGAIAGTSGESKRLEAIMIRLNIKLESNYDVYYQTHIQNFGWSAWAKNGEKCGSEGYSYRLEGIRIRILPKGSAAPSGEGSSVAFYSKGEPAVDPGSQDVTYNTHVQDYGWQEYVYNGTMAGTSGQSKRLEGIHVALVNAGYSGDIVYRTHVQDYGWQDWKKNGEMSGTSGESKRLEAIQIYLTGEMASHYDIVYQTHIQNYGWTGWARNGEMCGSAGYSYRLEGIRIQLVSKGGSAPGSEENIFYEKNSAPVNGGAYYKNTLVKYNTHVQNVGWQKYVVDGEMAGTQGLSLRLEGIHISLTDVPYSGGIEYRTHVQNIGWQNWKNNGEMAGTSGQSLRLEAIQIRLTGEMANYYDVYYRVHTQDYGWLDWAKNGEMAGTSGLSRRLEGINIVLKKKGESAPGSTAKPSIVG